jgi:hypothetical protein
MRAGDMSPATAGADAMSRSYDVFLDESDSANSRAGRFTSDLKSDLPRLQPHPLVHAKLLFLPLGRRPRGRNPRAPVSVIDGPNFGRPGEVTRRTLLTFGDHARIEKSAAR